MGIRKQTVALAVSFVLVACTSPPPPDPNKPPKTEKHYPPGAAGLRSLWLDIVEAAQKDEREKVHDLIASQMMTDEDLIALFGDEKGRWLKPRYLPMYSRLANIGAMELVAQISDQHYDEVEVFADDEKSPFPEARAVAAALKEKIPVYSLRVENKGKPYGLRYSFFVYRDAHWITGNQIGKLLVPKDTALPANAHDGGTTNIAPSVAAKPPTTAAPSTKKPGKTRDGGGS